jgi:hypothetical protein
LRPLPYIRPHNRGHARAFPDLLTPIPIIYTPETK